MLRFSRTLSNVGIYLVLILLTNIMIFSILLISIKTLMDKSYEFLWKFGQWLQNNLDSSLTTIQNIGVLILIGSLIAFAVLIFNLILVNSRKASLQRIGYIIGIIAGGFGLIISILPAIIFGSSNGDKLTMLVSLIFFLLMGLNNSLILTGSIFGMFFAKTLVDNYEKKSKS
ncbi:hypothetical protein [Spiroplasma diminutum]|uniref:Transmembrane protein n=1 Tax=Spiroplasma diminutum CUAS-1 TaxID=1276221 RepID=S5M211_9MOLU|nr:hypothetical protein [Spiroplasma diminutum]AGR42107.1 hypothetical protein SDIMI_v3c04030 [Spiroplasma diminutum CUAS-1]